MKSRAVNGDAAIEGTVTTFSDTVGWGTITAPDGSEFGFHCVEIEDGSRMVVVGTRVTFTLLPRFGVWQAGSIAKG